MKTTKLLIAFIFSILITCTNTFAASGIIRNGRTLVPVRGVFEELGFNVVWNEDVGKVSIYNREHQISAIKDMNYIKVDGKQIYPDVPQQVINGSLYLPVKVIVDAIGADMSWNAETKMVHIHYNDKDSYIKCVDEQVKTAATTQNKVYQPAVDGATYILNTNTKKVHVPGCSSINKMNNNNKQEYFGTLKELTAQGYSPCGKCNPK